MNIGPKVAESINLVAGWHRAIVLGHADDPAHQRALAMKMDFAEWVGTLPDDDWRLEELRALHPNDDDFFSRPGARTALRRAGNEWDCGDFDQLLAALVELEAEDWQYDVE